MPKEEWGTKRLCPHCGARFYDLRNDPMTCPACGTEFTVESLAQGRGRSLVSEKTASKDEDQDDDLIDDDLDDDDSGDIDDDLLEDDDSDDDVSLDDIADVASDDED
ncbi:MAG TPA: TIGR02300 family protein [Paracoccus sp. (in: a-proteobacteria)]|uniref:TIGR02300 family protein n=1 Tax=uncultured Paracoccus sp. TaxID=189685 RepID=UPI002630CAD3|nr:TIGR02300 family protein [uncultured Paracoccus sp.]HMQ42656.1 TIGR02300 family protein [Paracoccus sp. (in: a-proteobacteria)]HMR37869.1 TIGR02300 family protein [Paracoccus sp. (in: a-proteobacteria)]